MYHQQPQYASTSNNNGNNNYGMNQNQNHAGMGTIAPHETTKQPAQANTTPLVATGDWTKDLVHLAKTAELKCVFKLYPSRSQLADPNGV